MRPGQALVEFAIVLSLVLFISLGLFAVGLLMIQRMQLQHAAIEAAIVAADDGCVAGLAAAAAVLGYTPDEGDCTVDADIAVVTLTHSFDQILPVIPSTITVTGRSVPREPPSPEASG